MPASARQVKRVSRNRLVDLFLSETEGDKRETGKQSFATDMMGIVLEKSGNGDAKSVGKATDNSIPS